MFSTVVHACLLGFGLILPLGVQNVFVFNQGASHRTYFGALPVILTAAVCDTILISAAVCGVSLMILTFDWLQTVLYALGFFFLLYIGWMLWRSQSQPESHQVQEKISPKKQMLFAASVSLLNPHAIIDTVGVIGTNSIQYAGGEKWAFTISIILVSWIWFFTLALAGRFVASRNGKGTLMSKLNKISAVIIWVVAIQMAIHLLYT
ncbi:LysE/ArgO family amino acid transporter [Paenibacillus roseipurpureus]|uniref:LysE/ArgO family amino acid transporter n=1 Tax=Paenibacillus roseopurpureus TaxID=2918901 RepID=A0AA96LVS1_9BACL|nr:LysE/ArgO family amino acid transporter [Paenibacillus sp. MBLB1832]WNR47023.1 LysE/ArgO family amino acid transporter [Paenibacillus sp. MBLB1832]